MFAAYRSRTYGNYGCESVHRRRNITGAGVIEKGKTVYIAICNCDYKCFIIIKELPI